MVVLAVLAVAGNASAVVRSPYPARPSLPYQGRYALLGLDSVAVASKAVRPTVSSR